MNYIAALVNYWGGVTTLYCTTLWLDSIKVYIWKKNCPYFGKNFYKCILHEVNEKFQQGDQDR